MAFRNGLLWAFAVIASFSLSDAAPACVWCDASTQTQFLDCLHSGLSGSVPFFGTTQGVVDDLCNSLIASSGSMRKIAAVGKEHMMNNLLAGELAGLVISGTQDSGASSDEVLRVTGQCYNEATDYRNPKFMDGFKIQFLDAVRDESDTSLEDSPTSEITPNKPSSSAQQNTFQPQVGSWDTYSDNVYSQQNSFDVQNEPVNSNSAAASSISNSDAQQNTFQPQDGPWDTNSDNAYAQRNSFDVQNEPVNSNYAAASSFSNADAQQNTFQPQDGSWDTNFDNAYAQQNSFDVQNEPVNSNYAAASSFSNADAWPSSGSSSVASAGFSSRESFEKFPADRYHPESESSQVSQISSGYTSNYANIAEPLNKQQLFFTPIDSSIESDYQSVYEQNLNANSDAPAASWNIPPGSNFIPAVPIITPNGPPFPQSTNFQSSLLPEQNSEYSVNDNNQPSRIAADQSISLTSQSFATAIEGNYVPPPNNFNNVQGDSVNQQDVFLSEPFPAVTQGNQMYYVAQESSQDNKFVPEYAQIVMDSSKDSSSLTNGYFNTYPQVPSDSSEDNWYSSREYNVGYSSSVANAASSSNAQSSDGSNTHPGYFYTYPQLISDSFEDNMYSSNEYNVGYSSSVANAVLGTNMQSVDGSNPQPDSNAGTVAVQTAQSLDYQYQDYVYEPCDEEDLRGNEEETKTKEVKEVDSEYDGGKTDLDRLLEETVSTTETNQHLKTLSSAAETYASSTDFNYDGFSPVISSVAAAIQKNHPDWSNEKSHLKSYSLAVVALSELLQQKC